MDNSDWAEARNCFLRFRPIWLVHMRGGYSHKQEPNCPGGDCHDRAVKLFLPNPAGGNNRDNGTERIVHLNLLQTLCKAVYCSRIASLLGHECYVTDGRLLDALEVVEAHSDGLRVRTGLEDNFLIVRQALVHDSRETPK